MKRHFLKHYSFSIMLLASIAIGAGIGIFLKDKAVSLKPLGDVFLNLLFTVAVPLVFFSISSAISEMSDLRKLGKVLGWMLLIFVVTGALSATLMLGAVKIFPPSIGHGPFLPMPAVEERGTLLVSILSSFTVPDFIQLFSRQHMLALIVFSILTGLAASLAKEKGRVFADFLVSGSKVMMGVVRLVMFYAPIGLGAYFAYLAGTAGPELLGSYLKIVAIYYPAALIYFFLGFSFYAFWAGGRRGFCSFWQNILPPALTAWGTGSSLATVPVNFGAADRIGVPRDVSRIVIPVGATIHMDGTCLGAVLKIALLFSIFGKSFTGPEVYLTAVGIALLSGMVMSGIPGGGFLGELLIVTLYGFPAEVLPLIAMVGTLIDPPGTMVNATGDTVSSMLVSRMIFGPEWQDLQNCNSK